MQTNRIQTTINTKIATQKTNKLTFNGVNSMITNVFSEVMFFSETFSCIANRQQILEYIYNYIGMTEI